MTLQKMVSRLFFIIVGMAVVSSFVTISFNTASEGLFSAIFSLLLLGLLLLLFGETRYAGERSLAFEESREKQRKTQGDEVSGLPEIGESRYYTPFKGLKAGLIASGLHIVLAVVVIVLYYTAQGSYTAMQTFLNIVFSPFIVIVFYLPLPWAYLICAAIMPIAAELGYRSGIGYRRKLKKQVIRAASKGPDGGQNNPGA